MEYRLDAKFKSYHNTIVLVGCGGTGGFAAEGLCRLLSGHPEVKLFLIDGDRVEERNLTRQNFYPEDLGRYKSQALAERLARRYGRSIAYSVRPLERLPPDSAVVVGCVDNAEARSTIAQAMNASRWWVDAGNGREFGQVLIGNADIEHLRGSFDPETGICHALPLPTMVRPELLVPAQPVLGRAQRAETSCAQAVASGEQGPTINQFMGAMVVEVVRRLLESRLSWWQLYLDLEAGSLHAVPPTPDGVAKLTRIPLRKLVRKVVKQ